MQGPSIREPARKPSAIDAHVGQKIRMRRKVLGITQEALGDALGLTFQQVQKYEQGANRVSASKLHAVASFLGVPVSYFFEGLDDDAPAARSAPFDDRQAQALLSTAEGRDLVENFLAIYDPSMRTAILDLIRAAAAASRGRNRPAVASRPAASPDSP